MQYFIILPLTVVGFLLFSGSGGSLIDTARRFLNVREIQNNQGFRNLELSKLMYEAGFVKGYNYCVWFVKAIIIKSYKGSNKEVLLRKINGSSQRTWKNLKSYNGVKVFYDVSKAKPGDIVFYRWQNNKTRGHAEFFEKHAQGGFYSVSGNSPLPKGGQGIARRYRNAAKIKNGNFKLLGFVRL